MMTWSKIACAIDFSEASRAALEHAAELARRFHAELLLVHVRNGLVAPTARTAQEEAELGRRVEEWERDAEQIIGREVRTVLASGSPGREVARIASAERSDLVVTGTHGRTGYERAVLGSVAEEILRHAPCTVLVVKGPREAGDD